MGRALRRYGIGGTVGRGLRRVRGLIILRESHLWAALDLSADRPRPRLPPELSLRQAREADVWLLEELDPLPPREAVARVAAGHDLWLVLDGERPVFCCWIFRGRAPAIAAPHRWFSLPAGVVCQESSVTAPADRGRGIAPAAWSAIADALAEQGDRYVIRKLESTNAAARRAGDKAGFKVIATMEFRRIGTRSRTSVEALDGHVGSILAERLDSNLLRARRPG